MVGTVQMRLCPPCKSAYLINLESPQRRQAVPFSCHRAFGIAGHAGSADFRSHGIDHARRRFADLACKGRASFAIATHARQSFIDEFFRDQIERRIVLGGEPGPVRGIRTAGPASLAVALGIDGGMARFHVFRFQNLPFQVFRLGHDPEKSKPAFSPGQARSAGGVHQLSLGASQTRLLRHRALSRSRRSGYFSSRCSASITRSVRKLRKSLRSSHHAASSRTAS
jgi:hypothetical protein